MKIVVVDDDEGVCQSLERMLRSYGFSTRAFQSSAAFLASGQASDTDCLLLDVYMPGGTGLELQDHLRLIGHRLPVIFITGHMDSDLQQRALEGGATDILEKPFNDVVLIEKIKNALIRSAEHTSN